MTLQQTPNLSTWSVKDFSDYADRIFLNRDKKEPIVARKLFIVDPIGNNQGTEKYYQEYDMQTFARSKAEGANTAKVQAGTGYGIFARLKRIGAEIDITEEEIKYNKYPQVTSNLTNLSGFARHRMELDMTHRITNCTAQTYVNMDGQTVSIATADGLSLQNSAHKLAFSGLTFSNVITGDPVVSETSIETAENVAVTQTMSNFGEPRNLDWNVIFTSKYPTAVNTVRKVLQSTAAISASNAGVKNVFEAKYEHVILPYLATDARGYYDATKRNFWGLCATGQWSAYLALWEDENLRSPAPGNNLVNGHADVLTFGVRAGYDIAIVSGKGIVISANAT